MSKEIEILIAKRLRLEDVASGYWTLPFKRSSGLVSHYGSTPSSSARASRLRVGVLQSSYLKGSVPTDIVLSPA
jgi:hypothetical protein